MEGSSSRYEGFISCRGPSYEVARELALQLQNAGVRCAWQGCIADEEGADHVLKAVEYISSTGFSVILLHPGFHERSDGDHLNFQFLEIQRIVSKFLNEGRKRGPDGRSTSYAPIVVMLSETQDRNASWFQDTLNRLRIHDYPAASIYEQLDPVPRRLWIDDFRTPNSEARRASIKAAVETISQRAARIRELRSQAPAADQSPSPAAAQNSAQALLEAYIEKSATAWQKGKVAVAGQSQKRRSLDGALEFESARFMELEGLLQPNMLQQGEQQRQPVSALLFTPQQGIVYLTGEAGAGKTTVAAATALAYAWKWRPEKFRRKLDAFAEGSWLKAAETYLGAGPVFYPICLSIARLAAILPDPEHVTSGELVEAITQRMQEEVSSKAGAARTEVTADDFEKLMERERTVLILDGLDEVPVEVARAIRSAADDLYSQLRQDNADRFRLIMTGRPAGLSENKGDIFVQLQGADWSKVEEFVRRYVSSQHDKAREQERYTLLMEQIYRRYSSPHKSDYRLVRRPLLLKLFCWNYWNNGRFIHDLSFCEEVVEHLTADRKFQALRQALADKDADEAAVAATARRILGWLALRTFQNKLDSRGANEASLEKARDDLAIQHAEFGLVQITPGAALKIIRELEAETNLLSTADQRLTFKNHMLFCEFLVSEAIAGRDPAELVKAIGPSQIGNWSNALTFAERRLRRSVPEGSSGQEGWPYSAVLLSQAERLAAQDRQKDAANLHSVALSVLEENQEAECAEVPEIVHQAIRVYLAIRATLKVDERHKRIHALLRLGERLGAGPQRKAVQTIFDALLHPRRHWVECRAPGLPEGYRLADAPVHVAAYRVFSEAGDRQDPDLWDHLPPDAELAMLRTAPLGSPDCDANGAAIWAAQKDTPGGPVVGVNWFEAVAYCKWLTRRLREEGSLDDDEIIRLPTESEWRIVADLCANGRPYPFGKEIDPELANTGFLNLNGPSPAGVFAPCGPGLYDFGSNVRCWTTHHGDAPDAVWPPRQPRWQDEFWNIDDKPRVGGGSWACIQPGSFRASVRPATFDPDSRSRLTGMRLARVRQAV